MLKSRGHLSVLEHSNIVLKVQKNPAAQVPGGPGPFSYSELLRAVTHRLGFHRVFPVNSGSGFIMAGNVRAWIETLESLEELAPYHDFLAGGLSRHFPSLFPDPGQIGGTSLGFNAPGGRGTTGAAENQSLVRSSRFRLPVRMRPGALPMTGAAPGLFLYPGKHPLRQL